MGKPKNIEPINGSYNWGEFGSANGNGISFNPTINSNIQKTQSGINQYLNELINPSYDNESFRARQELLDASNSQYARQLGAEAMARGARGSATQNILASIAANRNNNMRQAMVEEDARVQNILSALSGIEGNYFNQGNIMANNILQRAIANQNINAANTNAYNAWKNNLISGAATVAGSIMGGPMGGALAGGLTNAALSSGSPYGTAVDPMQVMSANNMIG